MWAYCDLWSTHASGISCIVYFDYFVIIGMIKVPQDLPLEGAHCEIYKVFQVSQLSFSVNMPNIPTRVSFCDCLS